MRGSVPLTSHQPRGDFGLSGQDRGDYEVGGSEISLEYQDLLGISWVVPEIYT